jgi:hypothetical protein
MMLERNQHVKNSMKRYYNRKFPKKDLKKDNEAIKEPQLETRPHHNKSMTVMKSFHSGSGSRDFSTGFTSAVRTFKAIAKNVSVTIDNSDHGKSLFYNINRSIPSEKTSLKQLKIGNTHT